MKTDRVPEPARDVPVLAEYDAVVRGGGPAGCAAALASARHGARCLAHDRAAAGVFVETRADRQAIAGRTGARHDR